MLAAATIVLAAALAVAALGLATALARVKRGPGPALRARTVLVTTVDDTTHRGVVLAEHTDRITLRDAFLLHGGAKETPMGGLVHIPAQRVAWIQEIEPPRRG